MKHMWKNKVHKKSSRFSYENTIEGLSTMKRRVPDPNVILGQETGYLNSFIDTNLIHNFLYKLHKIPEYRIPEAAYMYN